MSNPSIDLPIRDTFTPTLGQTAFVLSEKSYSDNVLVRVNGVSYIREESYTYDQDSNTVTWLDVPFTLDVTDTVQIEYYS